MPQKYADRLRRCKDGHVLTGPSKRGVRCPTCYPPGVVARRGNAKDGNVTGYQRVPIPPDDVLDFAACSIETAVLFDPAGTPGRPYKDTLPETPATALTAIEICGGCPVRYECFADAVQWEREGVYGGVHMTPAYHTERKKRARHLSDPIVPAQTSAELARLVDAINGHETVEPLGYRY